MIVLMFLIILNELRNYFGNSKTFINTGFQEVNSILRNVQEYTRIFIVKFNYSEKATAKSPLYF